VGSLGSTPSILNGPMAFEIVERQESACRLAELRQTAELVGPDDPRHSYRSQFRSSGKVSMSMKCPRPVNSLN
jgi:hypothetical protein